MTRGSDPAEDESMVVHPATQAQEQAPDEPSDDAASDGDSDEDVSASQKLWPVKSIVSTFVRWLLARVWAPARQARGIMQRAWVQAGS
mgnify:FL=1